MCPIIRWLRCIVFTEANSDKIMGLRPDFTSKLVHLLAFGTPKFYIAPCDKIKHELVNLSSNFDVKSGLSPFVLLPFDHFDSDQVWQLKCSVFTEANSDMIMGPSPFIWLPFDHFDSDQVLET